MFKYEYVIEFLLADNIPEEEKNIVCNYLDEDLKNMIFDRYFILHGREEESWIILCYIRHMKLQEISLRLLRSWLMDLRKAISLRLCLANTKSTNSPLYALIGSS